MSNGANAKVEFGLDPGGVLVYLQPPDASAIEKQEISLANSLSKE